MSGPLMLAQRIARAFVLLSLVGTACPDILRVPEQYPDIQAALNGVSYDDSILVAMGTYAEELYAPPLRFWLIGDVEVDTGNFARPIIDPSTLDSARWRRCMNVPNGSEPIVERIAFVNRAPMYPPYDSSRTGGVFVNTLLPITFRHCAFDSIHRAIAGTNFTGMALHIVAEDCRFTHATFSQIRTDTPEGTVEVRRCTFEGGHFFAGFVSGGHRSMIEECTFTGDSISHPLYLYGDSLLVRNCLFHDCDSLLNPVLRIHGTVGGIVEQNVVRQNTRVSSGLVVVAHGSGEPLVFRHNQLLDNRTIVPTGQVGITVTELTGPPEAWHVLVDSNLFLGNSQMSSVSAKGAYLGTRTRLTSNSFFDLLPLNAPVIDNWFGASPVSEMRYSQFQSGDHGISAIPYPIDARWNYWGHPSGPYNANHNPDAQGARVDDAVLFDPWSPDTNFLSVPGIHAPLPDQFIFEAFESRCHEGSEDCR